ncbi:alpha/beta fold hydrolase [Mycolicibacterium sp. P1-5]|uniref:alpha/beta fold hydrolase n=1 Tax=Mycolicibacterium sp. P1-5 TaxID=2024617 RepID=UPI0011EEB313|nr:alpha/beta hydrolase [Mycolicibacterium sp. P1-5]KAA0112112.1 alpha/beta hydrolase [Mycolicibacterium sp. P1-5]
MSITFRGVTAVLLAGTGSDDDYVYRAFAGPLHAVGAVLTTPAPQPARLVASYLEALDDAARQGPIIVGGVSIGAAVTLAWALAHPGHAVAVLAALPAWSGAAQSAPAALSARHTAHQLRTEGLVATTAQMRASSPAWLAQELARSWLGQWPELPDAMEEAAGYVAPSVAEVRRLSVPMGVVGATDDPIHPLEVALEWVAAAPQAALRTVSLGDFGPNPEVLGSACLAALNEAAG